LHPNEWLSDTDLILQHHLNRLKMKPGLPYHWKGKGYLGLASAAQAAAQNEHVQRHVQAWLTAGVKEQMEREGSEELEDDINAAELPWEDYADVPLLQSPKQRQLVRMLALMTTVVASKSACLGGMTNNPSNDGTSVYLLFPLQVVWCFQTIWQLLRNQRSTSWVVTS
jgi:hypothetical protein